LLCSHHWLHRLRGEPLLIDGLRVHGDFFEVLMAADPDDGSLFFTTGNTGTGTYNGKTNLAESLVKLSPV
jgi:hypothetical protein